MFVDQLKVFEKHSYLNLETFRKSGEGVKTPVWFMKAGDVLYVRTVESSGKVKRIRRNPAVRIAPCNGSGKLLGEWLEAEATINRDEAVDKEAETLANKKYGLIKWLFELVNVLTRQSYVTLIIRPK